MLALSIVASSLISALVTLVVTGLVIPHPAEAQSAQAIVTAQRFVLQDAGGKTRAELGVDAADGYIGLILVDANGARRLRTTLDPDGNPSVTLHDTDFTRRVAMAANPTAGGVVLVRDAGIGPEGFQPVRARLAARNDGTAHIGLYNPPGETAVWVASSTDAMQMPDEADGIALSAP